MANKLRLSLLLLRLGVFIVMLMWTLDKFINPAHSAGVFGKFYFIPGLPVSVMTVFGALELVILAGFLLGVYKRFCYGAVLLFHAVSTLSSFEQYLSPFTGPHLLFFAAWPMLAACLTLYWLRHEDRLLSLNR